MSKEITENIISKIKDELGIEIDRFSYDYDIIKIISEFDSAQKNQIDQFIKSYVFENLKEDNLDKFLKFFNIYRTKGNNQDLYFIKVQYKPQDKHSLLIKRNCTIKYNDEYYKLMKDTNLDYGISELTVEKVFDLGDFNEPIYSNGGNLIFEKEYLKHSNELTILESDIPKNLTLISFKRKAFEEESDFELLEKSKSLFQSYGYSNIKKIEEILLSDNRIKSIYTYDTASATNIVIFPKDLKNIDDIINYNQHVVNYFKSSNINLFKPNLFEIEIDGLYSQIALFANSEEIQNIISSELKSFLSMLYSDSGELVINRIDVVSAIKKSIDSLNLNAEIDYRYINVYYNYYYKNNYNKPIFSDIIKENKKIKKSDVLTLGLIR